MVVSLEIKTDMVTTGKRRDFRLIIDIGRNFKIFIER